MKHIEVSLFSDVEIKDEVIQVKVVYYDTKFRKQEKILYITFWDYKHLLDQIREELEKEIKYLTEVRNY